MDGQLSLMKKYGHFFELDIMNQRFLIVSEINTIKEILKSRPKQFARSKSLLVPFEKKIKGSKNTRLSSRRFENQEVKLDK